MSIPDCYKCKHRRSVPGSCHPVCAFIQAIRQICLICSTEQPKKQAAKQEPEIPLPDEPPF